MSQRYFEKQFRLVENMEYNNDGICKTVSYIVEQRVKNIKRWWGKYYWSDWEVVESTGSVDWNDYSERSAAQQRATVIYNQLVEDHRKLKVKHYYGNTEARTVLIQSQ